jgi:hypothetical protein
LDDIHNLLVAYRTRLPDILVTYCTSVHQHIQRNTAQLSKPWQATINTSGEFLRPSDSKLLF